jgi:hypothetical protein
MHFPKLFFSALTSLAVASAAPAEMAGTEVAKSSDVCIVKYTNMNTSPAHSELTAVRFVSHKYFIVASRFEVEENMAVQINSHIWTREV